MSFIKDISIKNKIIGIIVMVTTFVIFIGIGVNYFITISQYKNDLVSTTVMYSKFVGGYCSGPLNFGYPDKVKEILAQLKDVAEIENCIVLDEKKNYFASFNRKDSLKELPNLTQIPFHEFNGKYLHVIEPVVHRGKVNGTIYIRASTDFLTKKMEENFQVMIISIIALVAISLFLSLWVQKLISSPILHLASITKQISEVNSYHFRVKKNSNDEIGILYDGFNKMLELIDKREQTIKENERQLREIIDTVPHGIFIKDKNGLFLLVNKAFASYYNLTPNQMVGLSQVDIHKSKEEVNLYSQEDKFVIEQNQPIITPEQSFSDYQGSNLFFKLIKIPYDYYGELCVLGVSVDITDEKYTKQELKDTQEQFSMFMNMLPACAFIKDQTSNYVYVNQYLKDNFNANDWIGKNVTEILPKYYADKVIENDKTALEHAVSFQEIKIDKNENIRHLETWKFPVKFDNKPTLIGGISVDFTKRKEAEDRIKYYVKELERNNQELEEFNYVASHDLREPLRTLTSYCELLKEDLKSSLTPEAQEDIDFIIEAANRMNNLIQDLLQLSRAGRVELRKEDVNLNECMSIVAKDLSTIIRTTKGTVKWENLPTVKGDPVHLTRVLQNLVNNGIKFHFAERPPIINVTSKDMQTHWEIAVTDNGIGIKEQYKEQIFLPFKRLHSRDTYEGTGIGLAICKKIIKRHNGNIFVESEFGSGSTFKFTLEKTSSV